MTSPITSPVTFVTPRYGADVLGGADVQWTLRCASDELRARLEATARDGGALSLGWLRARRDPHEVFRDLGAGRGGQP